jgi:hypothetical protein
MADENLILTEQERDEVIASRAARKTAAIDTDIIKPGISKEDKKRVLERLQELWK